MYTQTRILKEDSTRIKKLIVELNKERKIGKHSAPDIITIALNALESQKSITGVLVVATTNTPIN